MYVTATYKINIKVIRNYFVASVVHVNPRQTKGYCTGSKTLKANCKYKFLYSLYSTINHTKRRKTERDRKLVQTAFVLKAKRWPLKSFDKSPTINTFRLEETVYRVFWKQIFIKSLIIMSTPGRTYPEKSRGKELQGIPSNQSKFKISRSTSQMSMACKWQKKNAFKVSRYHSIQKFKQTNTRKQKKTSEQTNCLQLFGLLPLTIARGDSPF